MYIAQELHEKNIAEYVLYMWQIEDLIRAYGCSLSRIGKEYISRFGYTDEQKEEVTDWYGNLIRMMNIEGKRQGGHLQINTIIIQQLNELHNSLLQSSRFPFYNAEYYKVLPFIVELRNKGDKNLNEIETCMNALYGTMMLASEQADKPRHRACDKGEISTFIGMLNDYYMKDKKEGLIFDED